MAVKRPSTRETLAKNLRTLLDITGWTQDELARRSGVSQRMISSILNLQTGCSVETADALAAAFGLTGWHLIMPNLTKDLLASKAVQTLLECYLSASDEGRTLIDAIATREAQLAKSG